MSLKSVALALVWIGIVVGGCSSEPSPAEHLERARDYQAAGKLRAATIETRNALQGDADNAEVLLLLGELQLRTGDPAGAEKELRKAREQGAADAVALPLLARALLQQRKLDELLAIGPDGLPPADQARLLATRSLGWLASGEPESARVDAERAIELDAGSIDALVTLARLNAADGDLESARVRLDEVLGIEPEHAEAQEFLGDLALAENRQDEAIAAYRKAIDHGDNPLTARLKRAQIHVERDEPDAARADLDALSKAGVKLPEIDLAYGRLELREGRLQDAQPLFEQALQKAPEFAPALGSLALAHLVLGNSGQAEQYGKQLMAATDDSPQARLLLAAIRFENGRHDLAAETLEPIVNAERLDPVAARLLATLRLKQDRIDEAVELMGSVLRSSPTGTTVGDEDALPALVRAPSQVMVAQSVRDPETVEGVAQAAGDVLDEDERRIVRVVDLLGREEHTEALEEAESLAAAKPEDAALQNLLGRVHLAADETAAARASFERALDMDASNRSAHLLLAELDSRDGDLDAARSHLEAVLRGDGGGVDVLLGLARLEARAGDERTMLARLDEAREREPGSAAPVLALAAHHVSRAEHETALELLAGLPASRRDGLDVLQLEGIALLGMARFDTALERIERLIEREPEAARWRYLAAQAHAGLGDLPATKAGLDKALELDPDHSLSQLALARAALVTGNMEAAATRIDALRELIPDTEELGAITARYDALKSADTTSPSVSSEASPAEVDGAETRRIDSTVEALEAARELWTEGRSDKSIQLLEAWLEANPQDVAVRMTLADAHAREERIEAAVVEYEAVLGTGEDELPDDVRLATLNNLAWYLREADPDRASAYARRALVVSPDSVATLDTLAVVELARGDAEAAKRAFDRVVSIGTDDPTILYHGARIEAALGNDEAVLELLTPLIEDGIDFPEKEEAARLLEESDRSGD